MNTDVTHFRIMTNTLNFGDACIKVFVYRLTNKQYNYIDFMDMNFIQPHYFTVGSIMSNCTDNSIIWGSGFISQESPMGTFKTKVKNTSVCQPLKIIAIRGPLSHQKLIDMQIEFDENMCYGDPLMLMPLIMQPTISCKHYDIGIIPHYVNQNDNSVYKLASKLINKSSVKLINILTGNTEDKIQNFINQICACDTIISSSLHGVIMGIVYNKKTIFVNFSHKLTGRNFKFCDFFESINVDYQIPNLDDDDLLNKTIKYDKQTITSVCLKLIESCPFINYEMKNKYKKMLQNEL